MSTIVELREKLTYQPLSLGIIAMITSADEAITAHQRVAEALWRDAVKGSAAAAAVRELVKAARAD